MKIQVLASGSKGNATLIESNKTKLLIDIGITPKELEKRLQDQKVLKKVDGIIITHNHSDHIKGLKTLTKKYKIPIYTKNDILSQKEYNNLTITDEIQIKDINIELFNLSHDTLCSGLLIKKENKEIVYITDTGYINNKVLKQIKNKDIYIIESNHDEQKLMAGKYPFFLKQRILSDKGHLSNHMTVRYLNKITGSNTKYIVLAHLSEENNDEALVIEELNKNLKNKTKYHILIASQEKPTEKIEV